jgi:hypothetical protein
MRYVFLCISILSLTYLISLSGCKEDESKAGIAPAIHFITDSGFVFKDTVLKTGSKFKIGIICKGISYNITYFNYSLLTEHGTNRVDSGMNSTGFRWETEISKGSSKTETWLFFVRDRESNSSDTIRFKITLDSNSVYGEIDTAPKLELGAQLYWINGFYSFGMHATCNLQQAYQLQSFIDLIYYYDTKNGENNTIASPGANIDTSVFTGPWAIQNWTVKNTTRFELTTVTTAQFDACLNDSLILSNTFPYASGKRKAKNLATGDVYAFVCQSGIKGLFKVNSVTGTTAGSVNISIKSRKP